MTRPWTAGTLPGLMNDSAESAETPGARANALVAQGDLLEAYDILCSDEFPSSEEVERRRLLATVLCELGDPDKALDELEPLEDDVETLGKRARALKDIALRQMSPETLMAAFEAYEDGFRRTNAYWHGINAATLARLAGQGARSEQLARDVLAICQGEIEAGKATGGEAYWLPATVGEALLLLGRDEGALAQYRLAFAHGARDWRNLKTTRRNAYLILRGRDREDAEGMRAKVREALFIPPVGICVGHRVDEEGWPDRLPEDRTDAVGRALADWVEDTGVRFGVAGAAAGTDLLFAEAILGAEGVLDLFLPFPDEAFRASSVDYAGEQWTSAYRRAVAEAHRVVVGAHHAFRQGGASYEYGNDFTEGMARLLAASLDVDVHRVAVWDGKPGRGPGGTASMVRRWIEAGEPFDVIDPHAPERGARPHDPQVAVPAPDPAQEDTSIVAVLFADAHGFSRLDEDEVAVFVREFLGHLARWMAPYEEAIRVRETWGDGLHMVFDDLAAAGRFALEVQSRIAQTRWDADYHLPATMALRVGLHAGPVTFDVDPVTGRRKAFGTHVSHAARLEPVTPEGSVFASESFTALAAARGITDFDWIYVGTIAWAKAYGRQATYRLTPRMPLTSGG